MTKPLPDRLLLASPNERSYVSGRYDPEIPTFTSLLLGYWFSLATPNLPLSTSAKNLDLVDGLIVNSVYSAILATDVASLSFATC